MLHGYEPDQLFEANTIDDACATLRTNSFEAAWFHLTSSLKDATPASLKPLETGKGRRSTSNIMSDSFLSPSVSEFSTLQKLRVTLGDPVA